MTSYWELLRDPRWQRKRLEVMQRDAFACRHCGSASTTLNVHHTHYVKGRKPWEYEAGSLLTLCESCHEATERELAELRYLTGGLEEFECRQIVAYARAVVGRYRELDGDLEVTDAWDASGIAAAYQVYGADVERAAIVTGKVSRRWLAEEARRRLQQWFVYDMHEQREQAPPSPEIPDGG